MLNNQDNKNILSDSREIIFNNKNTKEKPHLNTDKKLLKDLKKKKLSQALRANLNRRKVD